MNADLRDSFSRIKPVCDVVMVCPTQESITNFVSRVSDLKKEVVQELQQYLLFPFITHIKSTDIGNKYELQCKLVDGMRTVLEKVTVNSYEVCMKIETSLLQLVFDNSKPGMIADVPEELKHNVMKCLTVLMLNIEKRFREKLLKTQLPLLAQAIFVSVHIAKLEKLRALRLAAINCVMAHTMTHPQLTDGYRITDPCLEAAAVDMLASILPGVLAALQDVATSTDNPGHACVVASLDALHRVLCLTMSDRLLDSKPTLTPEDFAKSFKDTVQLHSQEQVQKEVSCKETSPKDIPKRSAEWYRMASDKLVLVTKALVSLRTHEHYKVRKELAVFCSRVLSECTLTMQPSQPIVLDILITLAKDEWPAVREYSAAALQGYFDTATTPNKHRVMDNLCENFFVMLQSLPRVLNNIDSDRKLAALNLLHGYIEVLCDHGRPQRLTTALSAHHNMRALCSALVAACTLESPPSSHRQATPVLSSVPTGCPWLRLRYAVTPACADRLQLTCAALAAAESAELILDRLLELFQQERAPEVLCVVNWMMAGTTDESFIGRVLDTYLEDSVWYSPLELSEEDELAAPTLDVTVHDPRAWDIQRVPGTPYSFIGRVLDTYLEDSVWYSPLELSEEDESAAPTVDVTVHDPHAWDVQRVPDLYEGTVETRITGISYNTPRTATKRGGDKCSSVGEARRNLVRCCALVDGVGRGALALQDKFQRYMLRGGVKVLERAGSQYELLHVAGLQALQALATAFALPDPPALIAHNADYLTHQVTARLNKAWNTQSALEILSVIMEYSDPSLLDFLYGIVRDVLVQSCDKYYENNLEAYLQVFLSFVECIRKWFPVEESDQSVDNKDNEVDLMQDLVEFMRNSEEAERLLSSDEFEKEAGQSVEDMYREDLKNKEENVLDYDDKVTEEKPPLPTHVSVSLSVLRRCAHFVPSPRRRAATLALRGLRRGIPLLKRHEDELLPLVHLTWGPLACRLVTLEPVVSRYALELLVTEAELAKDFIHSRCVKEVLPSLLQHLRKGSALSAKEPPLSYCSTAACQLQAAALQALSPLAANLGLRDAALDETMGCVALYLSVQQPKPLQELAVSFFVAMLKYDIGATWHHLRALCNNDETLEPPPLPTLQLQRVQGSPYRATNKQLQANIRAIFSTIELT